MSCPESTEPISRPPRGVSVNLDLKRFYTNFRYDECHESGCSFPDFMRSPDLPNYKSKDLCSKARHILAVHQRFWTYSMYDLMDYYRSWALSHIHAHPKAQSPIIKEITRWVNAYNDCVVRHGFRPNVMYHNYVMQSPEGRDYVKKRIDDGFDPDLELLRTLALPQLSVVRVYYKGGDDLKDTKHLMCYFYIKLFGLDTAMNIIKYETRCMKDINVMCRNTTTLDIVIKGIPTTAPPPDRLIVAHVYQFTRILDSIPDAEFGLYSHYAAAHYTNFYDNIEHTMRLLFSKPVMCLMELMMGENGKVNFVTESNKLYKPTMVTVPSYIYFLGLQFHPVFFSFIQKYPSYMVNNIPQIKRTELLPPNDDKMEESDDE